MRNWFSKNYKTIIITAFLIPIITVAAISISHVTQWYGITNPYTWAIYLSVGIEIAALSSLAALSANLGNKVYFPFIIVTLIQFIGNIFFSYSFIDIKSESFKNWVELTSSLFEFIGVESNDMISHKRVLSFLSGGILPIISLSFLHMLVKFNDKKTETFPLETKIKNSLKRKSRRKNIIKPKTDRKDEDIEKIDKVLDIMQEREKNKNTPPEEVKPDKEVEEKHGLDTDQIIVKNPNQTNYSKLTYGNR